MLDTAFLYTALALLIVVASKLVLAMANGSERGLLSSELGGPPVPERVQALAATAAAAAAYCQNCIETLGSGGPPQLVEPSGWILAAAGGSQLIYLLGKTLRHH